MDWNAFCAAAKTLGFDGAGLCAAEGFAAQEAQVKAQPPLAERRQLRFYPGEDDAGAKSIAVLLYPYRPYQTESADEVYVDSYYEASNCAYHAAKTLEGMALEAGRYVRANVSYPAKEAAVRAGLGVIGKNSLLITKAHGTRVVIILFATDFELDEPALPGKREGCLSCGKCARVCPAGAIDENGMSHPERCIRNFMMEGVVMPEALRAANGNRLIGCDLCQRVCPMQPQAGHEAPIRFSLNELMTEDPSLFSASVQRLSAVIGRNAARPQRVRAQAALAAGNSGNPAYLPVLEAWSKMPFEAVSEHAKWAIRMICDQQKDEARREAEQ